MYILKINKQTYEVELIKLKRMKIEEVPSNLFCQCARLEISTLNSMNQSVQKYENQRMFIKKKKLIEMFRFSVTISSERDLKL